MPNMLGDIRDFFGAPAHLTDRQVVELRLNGLHFDRPYDNRSGERPEDALVTFFKSRTKDRASSGGQILDELFDGMFIAQTAQSDASARRAACQAFCRFMTVLNLAKVKLNPSMVHKHMSHFLPLHDLEQAQSEAYWSIVLATFPDDLAAQDRVAVTTALISDGRFLVNVAPKIAVQLPMVFLDEVLPKVVRNLLTSNGQSHHHLSNSARIALSCPCFGENVGDAHLATIHRLALNLRNLCAYDNTRQIASSILSGARSSTACFDVLVALEFRERLASNYVAIPDSGADTSTLSAPSGPWDRSFVTNHVPYAESIFFQMWANIASKADVSIAFRDIEWGQLNNKLESRQVSFLICNDKHFDRLIEKDKYIWKNGFMSFSSYPVIVNEFIYEKLNTYNGSASGVVDTYLSELEEGKSFYFATSENSNNKSIVPSVVKDIIFNAAYCNLDVEGNTDLFSALDELNLDIKGENICTDHNSVASVRRLIRGECNIAVVGGVQAAFGERTFHGRLRIVGYIESSVDVGILFKKDVYDDERYENTLWPILIKSWDILNDIWEKYKSGRASSRTKEYFSYFSKIADDHAGIPHFDGGRDELLRLTKRHTTIKRIGSPPEDGGRWQPIPDNGNGPANRSTDNVASINAAVVQRSK